MSITILFIIIISSYLVGAAFGASALGSGDEDLQGVFSLTILLSFIALLILIGMKIGGAA